MRAESGLIVADLPGSPSVPTGRKDRLASQYCRSRSQVRTRQSFSRPVQTTAGRISVRNSHNVSMVSGNSWLFGLVLPMFVVGVFGCTRHDHLPFSNASADGYIKAPADAHITVMSTDDCAGLSTEACGLKGGELSSDPRTEREALPLLRAACLRHDAMS